MKLRLISVGGKMPTWVEAGFREYRDRFPPSMPLELVEVPLGERGKRDSTRAVEREGQRMYKAIPADAHVVALDVPGRAHSTAGLARRLEHWRQQGRDVALLIGGPDGLAPECRRRADEQWSLSPLTLPHMLVRIVVAEQLYRAWTVLQNHPYHRC